MLSEEKERMRVFIEKTRDDIDYLRQKGDQMWEKGFKRDASEYHDDARYRGTFLRSFQELLSMKEGDEVLVESTVGTTLGTISKLRYPENRNDHGEVEVLITASQMPNLKVGFHSTFPTTRVSKFHKNGR